MAKFSKLGKMIIICLFTLMLFVPTTAQAVVPDPPPNLPEERINQIVPKASFDQAEFTPNGDGTGDSVQGTVYLAENAKVNVWISNAAGAHVKKVLDWQVLEPGNHTFTWDGKDFKNGKSPDGPYWIKVYVEENGIIGSHIVEDAKVTVKDSLQIKIPEPALKVKVTKPSVQMDVEPYVQRYVAKEGEIFTILDYDNSRYQVLVKGSVLGWISVADVDIVDLDSIPIKTGTPLIEGAQVLAGPWEDQRVLATLTKGKSIRILRQDGNWYRVVLDSGIQGWVRLTDLEVENEDTLIKNVTITNKEISPQYKVDETLTTISFKLTRKAEVSVLLRKDDKTIYLLNESPEPGDSLVEPGVITLKWNGRDKNGYLVPEGEYKLVIQTKDPVTYRTNFWENPDWLISVKGTGQWPLPLWRMKEIVPEAGFSAPEIIPGVPGKDKVDIKLKVTEKAEIQIQIILPDNTVIYSASKNFENPGDYTFTWDGHTNGGSLLTTGTFYLRLWIKESAGPLGYMEPEGAQIKVSQQPAQPPVTENPGGPPVQPPTSDPDQGNKITYVVKPGDSLWKIAQLYGTTIDTIIRDNKLDSSGIIYPGQKLIITRPDNKPPVSAPPVSNPPVSNPGQQVIHTVVKGDTLWKVAQKYGTTIEAIARANNLDPNRYLNIGQKLIIPGQNTPPPVQPAPVQPPVQPVQPLMYTVQAGDSLWKIAQKFNTTVTNLARLNNLNPNAPIYIGQKLKIK